MLPVELSIAKALRLDDHNSPFLALKYMNGLNCHLLIVRFENVEFLQAWL